jgi:hypothetical protein
LIDSVANVLIQLGVNNPNAETLARYTKITTDADQMIKTWLKWEVEQVTGFIEYLDGSGYQDLLLRKPWVDFTITEENPEPIKVWLDQTGFYGTRSGAFASSTKLTIGDSWAPRIDKGTTICKSGILKRLASSNPFWFPSDIFAVRAGGLSYSGRPFWPNGSGNIKVEYTFGFTSGTMPDDIKAALAATVGILRHSLKYGYPASSEHLGDYSYSSLTEKAFTDIRRTLSAYRDNQI